MKKTFLKLAQRLEALVTTLIKKLESTDKIKSTEHFEDLTPKNDLKASEYFDALKWALDNKNVLNIGITGKYGSGKSSVLRSFERHNTNYNYLNISLASFNADGTGTVTGSTNRLLEQSILQQIIYTASPDDIPESRFKRLFRRSLFKSILQTFLISVWIFSIATMYGISIKYTNILLNDWKYYDVQWIRFFVISLAVLSTVYFIYNVARALRKFSFSKLNIGKGEIELAQTSDSSILNKHLDEIIYFFQVNKVDVVILEDIDRFNSKEIFVKLRELNVLLNQSSTQIGRRIRFIYALRDDLFKGDNRTKFFDFIIPIIPIVNTNNAKEVLTKKLKELNIEEAVSKELVSDVSIYIQDMRMLINITNEYLIYRKNLTGVDLNQDKLFAIVVFKNMYSDEFTGLQDNVGGIYELFQNASSLSEKLNAKYAAQIEQLELKITEIDTEHFQSSSELRELILERLVRTVGTNLQFHHFRLNGLPKSITDMLEKDAFDEFRDQPVTSFYDQRGTQRNFPGSLSDICTDLKYEARVEIIESRNNDSQLELKQTLQQLENSREKLAMKKIRDYLNEMSPEKVLGEELAQNKLLVFLLRNGYIDEVYQDYISLFYEGSISNNDLAFIHSIKDRQKLKYNFELSNIDEVIKRIHIAEFGQVEVLNHQLIEYLLDNWFDHKEKLNVLLKQISSSPSSSEDFLKEFLVNPANNREKMVKSLSEKWPKIWQYFTIVVGSTEEFRATLAHLILSFTRLNDLEKINQASRGAFSQFISGQHDFIELYQDHDDVGHILEAIHILLVKFERLTVSTEKTIIYDHVYQNNLYALNEYMVELAVMSKAKLNNVQIDQLKTANYTNILNSECTELIQYIENNLSLYVSAVLLQMDSNNKESEQVILKLINSKELDYEEKRKFIEKQSNTIQDLSKVIDTDIWILLMISCLVEPSWENVSKYYKQFESIDESLTKFLNESRNYGSLSSVSIEALNDQELATQLAKEILLQGDISNESYEHLIKSIPYSYPELLFVNLNKEKVSLLVATNKLELNVSNYDSLQQSFDPLHLNLLKNNIQIFLEHIDHYALHEKELIIILRDFDLQAKDKLAIITQQNIAGYEGDFVLGELIVDFYLSEEPNDISFEVLTELLVRCLEMDKNIRLFSSQLKFLTKEQVISIMEQFGDPYVSMVRSLMRTRIENTDYHLHFLELLKARKLISSFEIKGDEIQVNAKKQI